MKLTLKAIDEITKLANAKLDEKRPDFPKQEIRQTQDGGFLLGDPK